MYQDYQGDAYAYKQWIHQQTNSALPDFAYDFAKKAVKVAIQEELTEKQRVYITDYFFVGLNMPQIAEKHGVNKSSVCRSIQSAKRKIEKCVKYSHPVFMRKGEINGK